MTIKIKPQYNKKGAYVDCDIKTLSKEELDSLKKALEEFGVLFFRNQDLDPKSYIKFAKNFGPPADYPMLKGLDGFPEITVVERKKTDKGPNFGGAVGKEVFSGFHTDSSYTKNPPRFTMLLAKVVPPRGQGNTEFSSQYMAYDKLPDEYKKKLENINGVFSSLGKISASRIEREKENSKDNNKKEIKSVHPIIRKINGKKTIYCSPGHLIKLENIDENEAKNLQDFLFNHQVNNSFRFSFEWEPKSLALWDNRSILHRAGSVSGVDRILHRITIH